MYRLSRILLRLSVACGAYCVLAILFLWPGAGLFIGILLFVLVRRRKPQLTTLGSARWADEDDLRNAGMLDAESGLILGRLPAELASRCIPATMLFDGRISDKEACAKFWSTSRPSDQPLVRLPHAIHTAVFSPSGGGKGVSCVVPFLLTCPDSCVVLDFKGENAVLTAEHRRRAFGHRTVLLDPFKVVTQTPDCFNPIEFIDKSSASAIDECNDLAKAMVIRSADEKEPHWNDRAEAWLAALLATVVQYG